MHYLMVKTARLEALCKSVFDSKMSAEGNLYRYAHLPKSHDCQLIALAIVAQTEASSLNTTFLPGLASILRPSSSPCPAPRATTEESSA